jgi:hypothetical protein
MPVSLQVELQAPIIIEHQLLMVRGQVGLSDRDMLVNFPCFFIYGRFGHACEPMNLPCQSSVEARLNYFFILSLTMISDLIRRLTTTWSKRGTARILLLRSGTRVPGSLLLDIIVDGSRL